MVNFMQDNSKKIKNISIEDEYIYALSQIGQIATSRLNLSERLSQIVKLTKELLKVDACSIFLYNDQTKKLVLEATDGLDPDSIKKVKLDIGEGITGICAEKREPLMVPDAKGHPKYKYFPETKEEIFTSQLSVPLISYDLLIGVININTTELHHFSETEISILQTISSYISGAIRNAQVYHRAIHRVGELTTIEKISTALSSTMELQELLDLILKISSEIVNCEGGIIRLFDKDSKILIRKASLGMPYESKIIPNLRLGEGIAGWVAKEKNPVMTNNAIGDERFIHPPESMVKTEICAPLLIKDEVIGTISLYNKISTPLSPEGTFNDEDLRLLIILANKAALAIDNAKLYSELKSRVGELSVLFQVSNQLSSTIDFEKVLDSYLDLDAKLLHADKCSVKLIDKTGKMFEIVRYIGLSDEYIKSRSKEIKDDGTNWVITEGKTLLMSDITKEDRAYNIPAMVNEGIKSLLSIPMKYQDRIIGVVNIYKSKNEPPFTDDEVKLLTISANQAAIAIENARLFKETENLARINQERLREISILYEIMRASSSTLDLDVVLNVILTGLTFGDGLGFNRAVLLLSDEKGEFLIGKTAVGPSSYEEAFRIWEQISEEKLSLKDILYRGKSDKEKISEFVKNTKSIKMPISKEGVVGRAVLENRPFNVKIGLKEFSVENEIGELLDWEDFAVVSLMSRDKAIGVIIVDNHFNKKPITIEGINFLTMFANQAGLTIDNATAHEKLQEIISSMEKANIKLQELKLYNENIVESITSAISVVDNNLIISSCNSSFEKFTGLSKEEIIGRSFLELLLKIEEFDLKNIVRRISKIGKPEQISKVECLANNKEMIVDVNIYPFKDSLGDVIGIVLSINDVTEIIELEAKFKESERLAMLGELSAGVAHEIRNPLVSIGGFVKRIQKRHSDNKVDKEYTSIVIKEVERLENIVREVLDLASPKKIEYKLVNLNHIVLDTLNLLENSYEDKEIKINKKLTEPLPSIFGSALQLKQVFFNILQNAIEASPEGGIINIETGHNKNEDFVMINNKGDLIEPKVKEKMLMPFFTTKTKGTGLGLSVSRRIVDSHYGRIEIDSSKEKGTTFTVFLPKSVLKINKFQ